MTATTAVRSKQMLKIRRTASDNVIFSLIGQFDLGKIAEVNALFASERKDSHFVVDVKELTRVDREAVLFLAQCEANGIKLENCPAFLREWIKREQVDT